MAAALAGSFTSGGTTTTWVPLIDASGSTLGLWNAASPQSRLATTNTYGIPAAAGDYAIGVAAQNASLLGSYAALELLGYAKLAALLLPGGPVPVIVATAALILFDIFDELFGGSSSPKIPRQLLHGRHPLYGDILGISVVDEAQAKCPCPTAPVLPDKRNVDDNIRASKHNGVFWTFNKTRPGGDWDYDRKFGYSEQNDYAGNFNFGACGRAVGFPDKTLVSVGGADQMFFHPLRHGFGPGVPFIKDPYGDTKAAAIRDGERYYDCGCY